MRIVYLLWRLFCVCISDFDFAFVPVECAALVRTRNNNKKMLKKKCSSQLPFRIWFVCFEQTSTNGHFIRFALRPQTAGCRFRCRTLYLPIRKLCIQSNKCVKSSDRPPSSEKISKFLVQGGSLTEYFVVKIPLSSKPACVKRCDTSSWTQRNALWVQSVAFNFL